jgi:Leucine-rich repeat (LRR) protein
MDNQSNRKIETSFPIEIYLRPVNQKEIDWIKLDEGPGYFEIPDGMEAEIAVRNMNDETIKPVIEELQFVEGLVSFNLSENRNVGNKGMRFVPLLTQISDLILSACGMNDYGIDPIIKMKNVHYLDISYCTRLTDLSIKKLGEMRSLEELYLRGIPKITHAALKKIERRDLVIRR